ncbi:amino acid permease [Bacillus cereus group sp. MYBK87-2]|uniref:amino acid permease n=1 Tax=Bacillus cereus group sp. MYBK87-2 TaxID=3450602 RepID=UPI003F791163
MSLLIKKTMDEEKKKVLNQTLGAIDLTLLGIGAIIGTGIFVLTGIVAAKHAGPAIVLSFILASIVCACVAFCYAEFASTVPVSGSVYSYTYMTLGEIFCIYSRLVCYVGVLTSDFCGSSRMVSVFSVIATRI